jgi:SAM-dependent methyltransferase
MSMLAGATPSCFLCRSQDAETIQSLSLDQLITLWQLGGVQFSKESRAGLNCVEELQLFRCRQCGFHFFDPQLGGGEKFYSELHAQMPGYYAPARPENERNARFAQEHGLRNILDIGCGTGFALDAARKRGLESYGIELNPAAATEAQSRGHTIFSVVLEKLDPDWHGHFDLISLNQLLEHLPHPVTFVKNCVRFLSSKGVIAIAVPSSEGVLRWHPWLAANWPPHHLSRWRRQDLYSLSEHCQLAVIKTGGNQLLGSELEANLLGNRDCCLALGKSYGGPSPAVIKLLAFLYRKTGMKYIFRSQGHSIFCFLKRKT